MLAFFVSLKLFAAVTLNLDDGGAGALEVAPSVSFSFDEAASDVSAGVYAFNLGYITTIEFADVKIRDWDLLGNTSVIQAETPPSPFSLKSSDASKIVYRSEGRSSESSGTLQFLVRADRNLTGTLFWEFKANGQEGSGSVNITANAVPEPEEYGIVVSFLLIWAVIRSKWSRKRHG